MLGKGIENMEKNGSFELLPKKEVIGLKKEYDKLNKVLAGIRDMDRLPKGGSSSLVSRCSHTPVPAVRHTVPVP